MSVCLCVHVCMSVCLCVHVCVHVCVVVGHGPAGPAVCGGVGGAGEQPPTSDVGPAKEHPQTLCDVSAVPCDSVLAMDRV